MLARLKQFFQNRALPESVKKAIGQSQTLPQLLTELDRLKTENELELNRLKEEVLALEDQEQEVVTKLQAGLTGRRKTFALQEIQRLRKQMEIADRRLVIFDRNILLHLTLIGKILDMEAMLLKGVEDSVVEEVLIDFETKLEQYLESSTTLPGKENLVSQVFLNEQEQELSALEQDILQKPLSSPEPKPLTLPKKKLLEEEGVE